MCAGLDGLRGIGDLVLDPGPDALGIGGFNVAGKILQDPRWCRHSPEPAGSIDS
jgi:hypothetical protein